MTSLSQTDTLRLWLASGQCYFYFCFWLQLTEHPGTGPRTKHLPGVGSTSPHTSKSLHQACSSFNKDTGLGTSGKEHSFGSSCNDCSERLATFRASPGSLKSRALTVLQRGKFKLQPIGKACVSIQKCSRMNPLELVFKLFLKHSFPLFPMLTSPATLPAPS